MLREFPNRQPEGRRWFGDDYFDLIVWFGQQDEITGFQLCYDLPGDERALTWHEQSGFGHLRVDDGDLQRPFKATPILVEDGPFDQDKVFQLFKEHSRSMDEKVARFILKKLEDYRAKANPV